jgi:hypothetical protein
MSAVVSLHLLNDGRDLHGLSFGIPGGVGSVAPAAAEIASGSADKNGRDSEQQPLSLNGMEDFRDQHEFLGKKLERMKVRRWNTV